jgi:integrase
MITTGIRVGELVSLRRLDLTTGRSARIVVVGKGRKERTLPLDKTTTAIVTDWMRAIPAPPEAPLFPVRSRNGPMSTDAIAQRVTLLAGSAAVRAPSLKAKTVTPHALRHTCVIYGGSLGHRYVRAA